MAAAQAAPACLTSAARATSIPPIATTGTEPARSTARRKPAIPCGGGSGEAPFERVAKMGPNPM